MEEKKVFNFDFTFEEVNVVLVGLRKLPFENSAPIIQKIIASYEEQTKMEAKKKKDTKEVAEK